MPQVSVFDSFSVPYVEEMYAKFLVNPDSVGAEWKAYFLGFTAGSSGAVSSASGEGEDGLARYARAWRERGHLVAWLNPLADKAPDVLAELKPEAYGLAAGEGSDFPKIYGGRIGIETAAVREPVERMWVQDWWEKGDAALLAKADKLKIYDGLVRAGMLEQFLHKKFVGAKRFSLEGVDGLLPMLMRLIEIAAAGGVNHVALGMAHRGRLNVLCNIFHKPLKELFAAFADKLSDEGGPSSGDVKYHLGKTYVHKSEQGFPVMLELLFNPSHLEAVNPFVLGVARGRRDAGAVVLPVLIHGDSAVAGQGVVAECNNMMGAKAYDVGGVLHLVANNQIGFTADVGEAGGAYYCTDVFKSLGVPIVHANADDVEACWKAVRFAWEYRQKFGKDAVVDLVGYRRWGHNEGDDPTFTQPVMYGKIRPHKTVAEIYVAQLEAEGIASAELKKIESEYAAELDAAFAEAQKGVAVKREAVAGRMDEPETVAESGQIRKVAGGWGKVPVGFVVNDKVAKVVEERVAMLRGEKPLNWGAAETAAYGVLAMEGFTVRITGQDAQRGTFSHRHAVLTGAGDNCKWNVLEGLSANGGRVEIANSVLSENAVMGFEYGYALARPEKSLVIWEAQFGDFANGAQVVVDQFLAAAEAKWGQRNHLTLLLPHGMEGQGPEHSSARLERYLQLCAEDNMRVCTPSSPAQIFHLLRYQAKHPVKKPLVVMTPKSGLRNPATVSSLSDLLSGAWQPVIGDTLSSGNDKRGKSGKVVVCSGKIYYELAARREADKRSDVALVRVEQLYPWPEKALAVEMAKFKARDVYWVQEEPRNMGAWSHVREYWKGEWGYLHYVGRPASASPAVGTTVRHTAEQKAVVDEVFG